MRYLILILLLVGATSAQTTESSAPAAPAPAASSATTPPVDAAAPVDPSATARNVLSDESQHKDPDRRRDAAVALGMMPSGPFALGILERMMSDKDVPVRVGVTAALGDLNSKESVALLKKALEDPVPEVTYGAAVALYEAKDPESDALLREIVRGETKASSGLLKREFRDFMRNFSTRDRGIRYALRMGVGFVPVPGIGMGYSAANNLMFHPKFSKRARTLMLLADEKSAENVKLVVDSLEDDDWSVQASAVTILARQDRREYTEQLIPLLTDTSPQVRVRAAATYLAFRGIKD